MRSDDVFARDHGGQVYFEDEPGRRLAYRPARTLFLADVWRPSVSFVFLTFPNYLRVRLQVLLRHSPSRRVLGAFLIAVESRHALSRDAIK